MDMKVVISINYGWNTIVWTNIRHLRHIVQNLLGVKVHVGYKILKQKSNWGHVIFIHKSYIEIVDKILK